MAHDSQDAKKQDVSFKEGDQVIVTSLITGTFKKMISDDIAQVDTGGALVSYPIKDLNKA